MFQFRKKNEPVEAVVEEVEVSQRIEQRVVDGRHQRFHHKVIGEFLGGVFELEVAIGHVVAFLTRLATTELD